MSTVISSTQMTTSSSDARRRRRHLTDNNMNVELEYIYEKHALSFRYMLVLQLVCELLFLGVSIVFREHSLESMEHVYRSYSKTSLVAFFWAGVLLEVLLLNAYYGLAVLAVYKNSPTYYLWFWRVAVLSVVMLILTTYLGRPFNLLTFFMRAGAAVYSQFLYNYLRSLAIQADVAGAAAN